MVVLCRKPFLGTGFLTITVFREHGAQVKFRVVIWLPPHFVSQASLQIKILALAIRFIEDLN